MISRAHFFPSFTFLFFLFHSLAAQFSSVQLNCQCACVFVNSTTCDSVRVCECAVGHKFEIRMCGCVFLLRFNTQAQFVCAANTLGTIGGILTCDCISLFLSFTLREYVNMCAKWMCCEALNGIRKICHRKREFPIFFARFNGFRYLTECSRRECGRKSAKRT